MNIPHRYRRLRGNAAIRNLVAETILTPDQFIVPLFITEDDEQDLAIASMPGYSRIRYSELEKEIRELEQLHLYHVLLFVKVPQDKKDNAGTEALNENGLMQRTIRKIKSLSKQIVVFTDVALDPFSIHGHDGLVEGETIVNDATVEVLATMSVSHARAGADFVAPSDMMDGRVGVLRKALDEKGFTQTGILAYSAKYASAFYGPFRDALDSAPGFGDKKTYQMDYRNSDEAVKETLKDIEEGADLVMVKPAGAYLDIIHKIHQRVHVPIAAYQVSGEYAMIKAAARQGWINEKAIMLESLMAIRRAGASVILSYFAKDFARHYFNK